MIVAMAIVGAVIVGLWAWAVSAERRFRRADAAWAGADKAAEAAHSRLADTRTALAEAEQRAQQAEAGRKAERDAKVDFLPVERVWRRHVLEHIDRGRGVALAVMDLDGFKEVNDTWGHAWGDHVIRTVAERLRDTMPRSLITRIGGDEFAILMEAAPVFDRVLERLAQPIPLQDRCSVQVRASFGVVALRPPNDLSERLHQADLTMLEAKQAGGGVRYWSVSGNHAVAPGERSRA